MYYKSNLYLLFILLLSLSCKSASVYSVLHDDKIKSFDSVYIRNANLYSGFTTGIAKSFLNTLIFSLNKRGFIISSFADREKCPEIIRYQADVDVFINKSGDILDREYSVSAFLTIIDSRTGKKIISIMYSCEGCNPGKIDEQIELCNSISSKLDSMVKEL